MKADGVKTAGSKASRMVGLSKAAVKYFNLIDFVVLFDKCVILWKARLVVAPTQLHL